MCWIDADRSSVNLSTSSVDSQMQSLVAICLVYFEMKYVDRYDLPCSLPFVQFMQGLYKVWFLFMERKSFCVLIQ